jgi:hypothetical protein
MLYTVRDENTTRGIRYGWRAGSSAGRGWIASGCTAGAFTVSNIANSTPDLDLELQVSWTPNVGNGIFQIFYNGGATTEVDLTYMLSTSLLYHRVATESLLVLTVDGASANPGLITLPEEFRATGSAFQGGYINHTVVVPEPSTYAMLGSGFLALWLRSRHGRSRRSGGGLNLRS